MNLDYKRTEKAEDKGEFNGSCNITACQKPASATWFHHSTRKYYCKSCTMRLNNNPYNKVGAQRLFGHDLLTQGEQL